jgi:hypothetical protein
MTEDKPMDFITLAVLIMEHINQIGEDRVFVVCMDGKFKGIGYLRAYPERVSLSTVFRVFGTWDGLIFEKRWIRY